MAPPGTNPAIHPLKLWRAKRGLLLAAGARVLGLNPSALSRYENYVIQPRLGTALRLARIAKLKVEQLYGVTLVKPPRKRRPQSEGASA